MSDRPTPETDALANRLIPITENITPSTAQAIITQVITEVLMLATKLERELDEAREKYLKEKEELDKTLDELVELSGRIAGISGQLLCSAFHVGKLEKENAKLRDIAGRAIDMLEFNAHSKHGTIVQLRAELDQLKEGAK